MPPGHFPPQLDEVLLADRDLAGLGPAFVPQIVHAMETKPRTPVLWLHGLENAPAVESFIAARRIRWPRTCAR